MSIIPKAAIEAAIAAYVDAPASASSVETMEAAILAAVARMGEPVAWRSRDLGDGWILSHSREEAEGQYPGLGCLIQPLFVAPSGNLVDQLAEALRRARYEIRRYSHIESATTKHYIDDYNKRMASIDAALDAYEAERTGE